jgi:hypothetical protein
LGKDRERETKGLFGGGCSHLAAPASSIAAAAATVAAAGVHLDDLVEGLIE